MYKYNLIYFSENAKKETWNVSDPSEVLKYYNRKDITRDYACYLLKIILETDYIHLTLKDTLDLKSKTLMILVSIHLKNNELFNILEEIAIAYTGYELRLNAIVFLLKFFNDKAKNLLRLMYKEDGKFFYPFSLSYKKITYEQYHVLKELSGLIDDPILKIYFYYKWFFDKYGFGLNYYQDRIYGRYKYFHGNLTFKIQSTNGSEYIHEITDQTNIVIEFDYSYLENRAVFTQDIQLRYRKFKRKIINLHEINDKYCYGISYNFLKRIMKVLEKLFIIDKEDYFFSFIRNRTIYFLLIDIPKFSLEILLPARRIENKNMRDLK